MGGGLKPFYQERLKKVSNFSHSPARIYEQEYLHEEDDDDNGHDDDDDDDDDDYPDDGVELAHGDLLGSLHCSDHLLLVLKNHQTMNQNIIMSSYYHVIIPPVIVQSNHHTMNHTMNDNVIISGLPLIKTVLNHVS